MAALPVIWFNGLSMLVAAVALLPSTPDPVRRAPGTSGQ
jgi:hypothetical protein